MDLKEIAYHEAGHAVLGYLFYPPVTECTIIPNEGRLGNTKCNIPFPLFGKFQNKVSASDYFKIALYSWSGEYFQRKISNNIDDGGLVVDKGMLEFYCDDPTLYQALNIYKDNVLDDFFADETLHNMVDDVVKKLLIKGMLNESDMASVLSCHTFNVNDAIHSITERFHDSVYSQTLT